MKIFFLLLLFCSLLLRANNIINHSPIFNNITSHSFSIILSSKEKVNIDAIIYEGDKIVNSSKISYLESGLLNSIQVSKLKPNTEYRVRLLIKSKIDSDRVLEIPKDDYLIVKTNKNVIIHEVIENKLKPKFNLNLNIDGIFEVLNIGDFILLKIDNNYISQKIEKLINNHIDMNNLYDFGLKISKSLEPNKKIKIFLFKKNGMIVQLGMKLPSTFSGNSIKPIGFVFDILLGENKKLVYVPFFNYLNSESNLSFKKYLNGEWSNSSNIESKNHYLFDDNQNNGSILKLKGALLIDNVLIKNGLNIVGFPIISDITIDKLEDFIKQCDIEYIWNWNSLNNTWDIYTVNNNESFLNELNKVSPLEVYFIKSNTEEECYYEMDNF